MSTESHIKYTFSESVASLKIDEINQYFATLPKYCDLQTYPNGIFPLSRTNASDYQTIIQVSNSEPDCAPIQEPDWAPVNTVFTQDLPIALLGIFDTNTEVTLVVNFADFYLLCKSDTFTREETLPAMDRYSPVIQASK